MFNIPSRAIVILMRKIKILCLLLFSIVLSVIYYVREWNSTDNHIYIIILRYGGQQGAGAKAIMSFQCWETHSALPGSVHIVEPALPNAILTGDITESTLTFGDLFDLDQFNSISRKINYTEIITADQYFTESSRKIVFVSVQNNKCLKESYSGTTNDCYSSIISRCHYPLLEELTSRGYCIVEILSVNDINTLRTKMEDILR